MTQTKWLLGNLGPVESTPQQITCGRKRTFGKQRRHRAIHASVNEFHARFQEHLTAELNQPTGQQVITAAATFLGYPYYAGGCRCEVGCSYHDCSGLVCVVMNMLGLPHICTSSFGFAQIAVDNGLVVSRDYAMHNPGCVAIRNPFGSSNNNGSNGHIVFMVGDGTDATIEEAGTRTGCIRGHESNRGFSLYMRLPGVNMTPVPVAQKVDNVLFLDHKHKAAHPARTRSVSVDPAGNMRLGNGARLVGQTAKTVLGLHVITPPSNGAPYMGAEKDIDGGGFTLQFLQKDGSYADFHFDFAA